MIHFPFISRKKHERDIQLLDEKVKKLVAEIQCYDDELSKERKLRKDMFLNVLDKIVEENISVRISYPGASRMAFSQILLSGISGVSPKKISSGMLDDAEYVLLRDICERLGNAPIEYDDDKASHETVRI